MEPGDPAKAAVGRGWHGSGAFAALVLAVGLIAFFQHAFRRRSRPRTAHRHRPPDPAPLAAATPDDTQNARAGRRRRSWCSPRSMTRCGCAIYEEGGERLLEKRLARDERYVLPADASDPRINTGRPDALAITVGGKSVPPLADTPVTISRVPVSAAALLCPFGSDPDPDPRPQQRHRHRPASHVSGSQGISIPLCRYRERHCAGEAASRCCCVPWFAPRPAKLANLFPTLRPMPLRPVLPKPPVVASNEDDPAD